jgi:sRNA-binding protein
VLAKNGPGAGDAGRQEDRTINECPSLPPSASAKQRPDPEIAACIQLLTEIFPKCFVVYEGRRRPLKVGIHNDIITALAGAVTAAELGRALSVYTHNKVYRSRLRAGAIRIDLSGEWRRHA